MINELDVLCKELTENIKETYESGVTLEDAEKLAAKFLYGQIEVANALKILDLSVRMRKNGLKSTKSALRQQAIAKVDKKPTEGQLDDLVNLNEDAQGLQEALDTLEVAKEQLEYYMAIFGNAHIYFRGVAKGGGIG